MKFGDHLGTTGFPPELAYLVEIGKVGMVEARKEAKKLRKTKKRKEGGAGAGSDELEGAGEELGEGEEEEGALLTVSFNRQGSAVHLCCLHACLRVTEGVALCVTAVNWLGVISRQVVQARCA